MEQTTMQSQSDHDLLVTLVANVGSMRDEMRQNSVTVTTQASDHEARLRVLEQSAITQKGANDGRREMSGTVKWIIGTLIAAVAVGITAVSVLVAQR
jgi:hypothetical protein